MRKYNDEHSLAWNAIKGVDITEEAMSEEESEKEEDEQ